MIENSSDTGWRDDDAPLLAALAEAVAAEEPVPPEVVAAAKAAYTWRTVDAELAALTYDSLAETELSAQVRSALTSERSLSFEIGDLCLDVDVTGDRLLGQLTNPRPARVTVETPAGPASVVSAGESGFFSTQRPAAGLIRLRVDVAGAAPLVTPWIRL